MSQFRANQSVAALKRVDGTRESTVITMPAVGDATQSDYIIATNAAGTTTAVYVDIDADGTAPTGALYTAAGSKTSVAYKNAVQETYVVTFPATAGATQADYFMIYDEAGNSTAVNLDIDADTTVPTGALYVGSDSQIEVDIATGDTAAQVCTKAYTALNGNVTNVSFTDNLDGTLTVTLDNAGPASADAVPKNADDSGAGSISVGTITAGVVATTAIAGGALLASATIAGATMTDNGDGTVTIVNDDVGNATDVTPKNADDSGAGSISVSATDGAAEKNYRYKTPASSPADFTNEPSLIS